MTTDSKTTGELAEDYARHLAVAVLKAGPCGRVHVQPGDPGAGASHLRWPSLRLHICHSEVAIYCVPTGEGIVLAILAAGQPQRWLPTYDAAAEDFAAAAYTIARNLVSYH